MQLARAVLEHVEKRPDLDVGEQRMAKVGAPVDLVAVPAAFLRATYVVFLDQVGNDLLRRPLADSDAPCDLADPNRRVAGDAGIFAAQVARRSPAVGVSEATVAAA
jgi:hypothetical protein